MDLDILKQSFFIMLSSTLKDIITLVLIWGSVGIGRRA